MTASGSDPLDGVLLGSNLRAGRDLVAAVCEQCEQAFEYEREWVAYGRGEPRAFARSLCDRCTGEKEEARQLEEKKQHFDWAMTFTYADGDRGSRLAKASFAAFDEGPHNALALRTATKWRAEERRPNLLIVGPIASGKSYLAACLYSALMERLEPAYWVNAGSLMAQIRRGFTSREAAEEAGSRIERAGRAPLLVLDDLGKVHPGKDVSWVEETFYAVVEARYRNELPTIVTTEWKSAALAERVGASVVSRLEDGAWVAGIKQPAIAYRRPTR
jgi:DNA replication protein DnaC